MERFALSELVAQRLGCGDDEVADLDRGGGTRFDGAVASDSQRPD